MWAVPASYVQFMRRRSLDWDMKVTIDGVDYGRDVVMDFTVDRRIVPNDEFVIGTVNLAKLEIKLRMQREIPPNAKIAPYLALNVGSLTWNQATIPWDEATFPWLGGNLGWIPMGEFYVDSRQQTNNVWVYTCFDRLYVSDTAYLSNLTFPATMQAVWNEMCERLGYTYDDSVVINPSYTIPAGPASFTMRQVMGFIASANGASVYMGRDGIVRFKRFETDIAADFEMNESDYNRLKLTNPIKTYNRIVVQYDDQDAVFYESGSGSEAETLYISNPYATQAMANALQAQLGGFSYTPIDMDARGYPHLDPGDTINVQRTASMRWLDADMPWQEANFPWNGVYQHQTLLLAQTFTYRGGLVMAVQSPSVSDQKSEFPTPGTLTSEVNRLNKDAVQLGRKYYGASFSRESGFTVDREDNLAKSVWNADEFTFYVGSDKALWFDVPNRKFKFGGDLEAAGGTFTGTLQGVDGTFSGTIQGGSFIGGNISIGSNFSVNNAGHMVAVGADFSGTITASVITGGQINGGTINGSDIIGSVFRTATSGRRIQISSSGLGTFDSSGNNRIAMTTSSNDSIAAISFFGANGAFTGEVNAYQSSGLTVFSNDLFLGSNNTANPITIQGRANFTGVVQMRTIGDVEQLLIDLRTAVFGS